MMSLLNEEQMKIHDKYSYQKENNDMDFFFGIISSTMHFEVQGAYYSCNLLNLNEIIWKMVDCISILW